MWILLGEVIFLGAILANNYQHELFPVLEKLLKDFQREGLVKWKQMKCVELAMALLAKDLIANGVCIDIESTKIDWPMGIQTEVPVNEGNKKKGGKCSSTNKPCVKAKPSNVFGQLVNDVQSALANMAKFRTPRKEGGASTSSSMFLPDLNPSAASATGVRGKDVPNRCDTTSIPTEQIRQGVNEFAGGHVGLSARPKKHMYFK